MYFVLSHPDCGTLLWQVKLTQTKGWEEPRPWMRMPGLGLALPLLTVTLDKAVKLSFLVYKMGK